MKTNKLVAVISAFITSLTALFMFAAPHAFAAAKTWTGGGTPTVDSTAKTISFNVSDGTNWSGGTAPVATDSLIFPANLAVVDPGNTLTDDSAWKYIVNNDLAADTAIAGIQFTGIPGADCGTVINDRYSFRGNAVSLSADVRTLYDLTGCTSDYLTSGNITSNITITAPITIDIEATGTINFGANNISFCDTADSSRLTKYPSAGVVTGSGTITVACGSVYFQPTTTFTGSMVVYNSSIANFDQSFGQTAGKTVTIKDKAYVYLYNYVSTGDLEFKSNIVTEGTESTHQYCPYSTYTDCTTDNTKYINIPYARLSIQNSKYDYPTQTSTYYKTTLSGTLTLASATHISTETNVTVTGAIIGNFALTPTVGSTNGSLTLNSSSNASATANGVYVPEKLPYIINADLTTDFFANSGSKNIINEGIKATNVTVNSNSIFGGKGTVAILTIMVRGTLSPGMSPGCLNSGNLIFQGGTYQVELGGTTACTEYDQMKVTGTVALGNDVTTLDTSLYNNFKPKAGDTFTIIDNDAADAVSGTFKNLAEGATFDLGGNVMKITYKGGDGNDVVLSVVSVPKVANTGFRLLTSSPIAIMAATVLLTASAYVMSKRYATAKIK